MCLLVGAGKSVDWINSAHSFECPRNKWKDSIKMYGQVGDEIVGSINQAHSCENGNRLSVSVKGEDILA
jgi:hypothetical protein